jgi:hypothetical protein
MSRIPTPIFGNFMIALIISILYLAIAIYEYRDEYPIRPRAYQHKLLFSKTQYAFISLFWLPIAIFIGMMFGVRKLIQLFK